MNAKIRQEITNLKITDLIFVIYIIIAIAGLLANNIEEKSIDEKNIENPKASHYIRLGIFIVSLIIYIYFVYRAYQKQKRNKLDSRTTKKQLFFDNLSLLATILFFIGGLIFLYLETQNTDEEEIAFE